MLKIQNADGGHTTPIQENTLVNIVIIRRSLTVTIVNNIRRTQDNRLILVTKSLKYVLGVGRMQIIVMI